MTAAETETNIDDVLSVIAASDRQLYRTSVLADTLRDNARSFLELSTSGHQLPGNVLDKLVARYESLQTQAELLTAHDDRADFADWTSLPAGDEPRSLEDVYEAATHLCSLLDLALNMEAIAATRAKQAKDVRKLVTDLGFRLKDSSDVKKDVTPDSGQYL